ncbi:hypothetical protein D5086_000980 [Populus alba]|uniref:Uncharacterized protein n=1 Tax=Populus alba TaxID=43335 RepID=A0ACC4CYZ4_POPAL
MLTPRNCSVTAKYSAASDSPTYSMVLMYVEFGVDLADGQSPDLVLGSGKPLPLDIKSFCGLFCPRWASSSAIEQGAVEDPEQLKLVDIKRVWDLRTSPSLWSPDTNPWSSVPTVNCPISL